MKSKPFNILNHFYNATSNQKILYVLLILGGIVMPLGMSFTNTALQLVNNQNS